MKKLLILALTSALAISWSMIGRAVSYDCNNPTSNTVTIIQNREPTETLYASISNGHCVNNQSLVSFTTEKKFTLPVHTVGKCNERNNENLYYNVNVYQDSKGTLPVKNVTIMVERNPASDEGDICSMKSKNRYSNSNYPVEMDVNGSSIKMTIKNKATRG